MPHHRGSRIIDPLAFKQIGIDRYGNAVPYGTILIGLVHGEIVIIRQLHITDLPILLVTQNDCACSTYLIGILDGVTGSDAP